MKLSEAIRLGATMKPQAVGQLFIGGGSCALGAASDAISGRDPWSVWRDVMRSVACCPADPGCYMNRCNSDCTLDSIVVHLNDQHLWTRERIADFVELHEGCPEPESLSLSSTENMENVR